MQKILLAAVTVSVLLLGSLQAKCQTLPVGACGIVYTYDAAGFRYKRQYVCNTGASAASEFLIDSTKIFATDVANTQVLYPNPTTGVFNIRMTTALKNAVVTITDMTGRVIMTRKESGNVLNYDLSNQASGEYFVTILQGSRPIMFKVIVGR